MNSESSNTLSPPNKTSVDKNSVRENSAGENYVNTAARGGNLRVSLACPQCDRAGWITWQNLGRAIRCPACEAQFQIGRLGKPVLRDETPRVRYQCPRCRQSGELPATLAVRGVECLACQLTLVVGPDQKLHDKPEAEQLRKARRDQSHAERIAAQSGYPSSAWYFQPMKFMAASGLLLTALTLGFLGSRLLAGNSPETRVEAFTAECLAGDWNAALDYVTDDPVQQAEFTRWRVRHFTSILDKHRPRGDRMNMEAELMRQSPQANTYRVRLTSEQSGNRAHQQVWRTKDGHWYFDVLATLALSNPATANNKEDQPHATQSGETEPPSNKANLAKPQPNKPQPKLPNNPYSRQR